jgi:cytochrome P450
MLYSWDGQNAKGFNTVADDTVTLALNVLTCAGFGRSARFQNSDDGPSTRNTMTFQESLLTVLQNLFLVMVVPESILPMPFLPKSFARVSQAVKDYKRYMIELLNDERKLISEGIRGADNLISVLIRNSDATKAVAHAGVSVKSEESRGGLSDKEIFGNIFIYSFAGHETTACTLAYAIFLLAGHPQWQEWIAEEAKSILQQRGDPESWAYEETFPRLNRCLAVMVGSLCLVLIKRP